MGNNEENLMALLIMNTIGLSIIYAEFSKAYMFYSKPKYHPNYKNTASDSLAFIQGTGLEIVIDTYHLMYDPDQLRNTFFSMVGDHANIK